MWSCRRLQSWSCELFAEYLSYCTVLHTLAVYGLFSANSLKNYFRIYLTNDRNLLI